MKKITCPKLRSKDKIEKNNFFIKWQRTKIKNQKDKNLSGNNHKSNDNYENLYGQLKFQEKEKEKRGKKKRCG